MSVSQIVALVISILQQLGLISFFQAGLMIGVLIATVLGLIGGLQRK